ncbi:hypothetical protein [Mucilaginibacter paludis]|uniref:DUF5681 domain-containing protein n=1 Tax=Mucilaginibacter paludis DSM 18603 TaxID=714943 RepID=H1Y7B7_9SPHI|nr:hypothetical protein [Mucilaginibacter paludis]EHQ29004.1 hypothetical protein Mucpa_4920 [Mucilaginibacter paludis DSM 18603]
MGLKKGMTNNPAGRKKGVPNKVSTNLRMAVNKILDENWSTIQRDLKKLEPKDRLAFIEKLLSYSLPKLQATTIDATIEMGTRIEEMNTHQLNILIDNILNENAGVTQEDTGSDS